MYVVCDKLDVVDVRVRKCKDIIKIIGKNERLFYSCDIVKL